MSLSSAMFLPIYNFEDMYNKICDTGQSHGQTEKEQQEANLATVMIKEEKV